MWGNGLGWSISLVWIVAVATGLWFLNQMVHHVSPRTDFSYDAANAAEITLPVPPDLVLPGMTDPSDAAPIYRRAIAEFERDPLNAITYDHFLRSGRLRDIPEVRAINILPEATQCASAKPFASNPAEIVNYDNEKPALDALRSIGQCAIRAALLLQKDHPDDARRLYEAVFSLGTKLVDERLSYAELDTGLTLIAQASTMIGQMAQASGDSARADAVKQFDEARIKYVKERIQPSIRVIMSNDQATLEEHAGDVFYFARHAPERMWRVESILKIGRYRFNAGRVGDQRSAIRALDELSKDRDPVIRTAAIAAQQLTIERYRMLR